jgi:hypothetical protein
MRRRKFIALFDGAAARAQQSERVRAAGWPHGRSSAKARASPRRFRRDALSIHCHRANGEYGRRLRMSALGENPDYRDE